MTLSGITPQAGLPASMLAAHSGMASPTMAIPGANDSPGLLTRLRSAASSAWNALRGRDDSQAQQQALLAQAQLAMSPQLQGAPLATAGSRTSGSSQRSTSAGDGPRPGSGGMRARSAEKVVSARTWKTLANPPKAQAAPRTAQPRVGAAPQGGVPQGAMPQGVGAQGQMVRLPSGQVVPAAALAGLTPQAQAQLGLTPTMQGLVGSPYPGMGMGAGTLPQVNATNQQGVGIGADGETQTVANENRVDGDQRHEGLGGLLGGMLPFGGGYGASMTAAGLL